MKIINLDARALNPGDLSWDVLNQFGEVTLYERTESEDEAIRRIADHEIILVNKVPITENILNAANAIITPHVSGGFQLPETLTRIVKIACENLVRFRNGETLRNLVDFETGYKVFEK